MDDWTLISRYLLLSAALLAIIFPGAWGLQCYNCKGITDYDDNRCMDPEPYQTLIQECQSGEVCEKKLIRIDAWTEKVVRGCSSNCAGRTYIWTEDFRVHCCNDDNLCNAAQKSTVPLYLVCTMSLLSILSLLIFKA